MRSLFSILFTLCVVWLFAQQQPKLKKVTRSIPPYFYEYTTLKADTAVYEGWSKGYYKGKIMEQGNYSKGECVGKWQFFSFKGIFDFEFDFDEQVVTRIAGSTTKGPYENHQSFFLGSPIIPHIFIIQNVFYPQKALEKDIKGKVVVALTISPEGKVMSAKVESSTDRVLNEEVLKAVRKFPREWRWIPAKVNNKPTSDIYRIVVHFDID